MKYFIVWTTNLHGHGTIANYYEATDTDDAFEKAMQDHYYDYIEDIEEITEEEYIKES